MDNMGIVVDDIDAVIRFFEDIGLMLQGRGTFEGPWMDRTIALDNARCEIAMLRTPDGSAGVELSRFERPPLVPRTPATPVVNQLGYLRLMFDVEDVRAVVDRVVGGGGELVDEIVNYEDSVLLCYVRGPEGIMVGLAQQLR